MNSPQLSFDSAVADRRQLPPTGAAQSLRFGYTNCHHSRQRSTSSAGAKRHPEPCPSSQTHHRIDRLIHH
jgi:hypothetical protein